MSPGGCLLLGTTCAIAWLDGGLSALVVGSAVGGGTYWAARRNLNTLPGKVLKQQKAALEHKMKLNLPAHASPEDIREAKREAKEAQQKLEAVQAEQQWGNKELAALAGLAAFCCPVLGCVALAGLTGPDWANPVNRAGETLQKIARPRTRRVLGAELTNTGHAFMAA